MENTNQGQKHHEDKKSLSTKLIKKNPNYVPVEIYKSKKSQLKCAENKRYISLKS